MKKLIKYTLIITVLTIIVSCEDFLEPVDENRLDFEFVSSDPASAEGLLLNGYGNFVDQFTYNDVATDDAVNNRFNNQFKRMALGELNAQFNPTSRWNNYQNILWVNKFLEIIEAREIIWAVDPDTNIVNEEINEMFYMRMEGEALALRGLHHFYILQTHAGIGTSGELLGIPYIKEFIESNGNFNTPRLSFEETVNEIINDFDAALALLPTDYSDGPAVDPHYQDFELVNYKVVNGLNYDLRMSGRIVKSLKARLALFAASPAFLNRQDFYSIAANVSSEVLNTIGGVAGLSPDGVEYFTSYNRESSEIIWRGNEEGNGSSGRERRIFPPSVNGNGEVNPTQNIVDAFPMKNGLPATAANGFNEQDPYANRDPRLAKFIVVNGSSFGGGTINTGLGGNVDRLDSIPERSTVTGYYLKKTLRPDVRINNDGSTIDQRHYNIYFRYTELFLIFAEAANEIGGPDHNINGLTPRDIIAAIRQRAGLDQPDNYLASITTKEAMRELIKNERRLELSFEGHRFWDLRRWGESLNEPVNGIFFNGTEYITIPSVESRNFPSNYMPIPNDEVLKFPLIEQNTGY